MRLTAQKECVTIGAPHASLDGMLELPDKPVGIVAFAHGSGSSRLSPRNNFVAEVLRHASFGTLLLDLLTRHEDEQYKTRFDIALLTERLDAAIASYNRSVHQPCSLSAVSMSPSSTSTAQRSRPCAAKSSSTSSRVRPTCSKNPVRLRRPQRSLRRGSGATWPGKHVFLANDHGHR